uniref:Nucleotidyltransferase n=1 Tax=Candidatus Methanogaster sp. ANME-2c ERB4 TaxID=2759911 RepID=A0A7G9YDS7_9EURY|nr:hypothetical protein LJAJCFKK_00012 [Methanosarcinales archaeon ANME-2c ERB4]
MIEATVQLENFENATKRLKAALEYDPLELDIVMDAVIQRFEFTFETAWKSVKLAAKVVGYDCKSPKGCLKLAYRMGWIKDEERWLELLEARNLTSHTYVERLSGSGTLNGSVHRCPHIQVLGSVDRVP